MALSGNYTSLKEVIAKVYRDFRIKEEDRVLDMIEWAGEALEQIGTFEQLETKTEPFCVDCHRIPIPCGLVYLNQIRHNGVPMLPSTNSFGPTDKFFDRNFPADTGLPYSINQRGLDNATLVPSENICTPDQNTYWVVPGYIKTSFSSGTVEISYQRVPLDDEGYPLIPDEVSFKEAVYRYIIMKMIYPDWVMGTIRDSVYSHAQERWDWYCGQAGAKAMMPNLAEMENIKKAYFSLRPKTEQFRNSFNNLNKSNVY